MHINRRNFIGTAVGFAGLLDSALPRLFAADPDTLPDGLFESPDPAVRGLAAKVYQQCILGKVLAPRGCLEHRWITPGGGYNEKVRVGTIGSWIPLTAGVPTQAMADRMAKTLMGEGWNTPLPVPTLDRNDPHWKSNGAWLGDTDAAASARYKFDVKQASLWRGDVWPATNYQVATGLAAYGHKDLAAEIADKTVANAIRNGISEHYDSITGKALGVSYLGMSCSILTLMLDGLTRQHQLKIRKGL